MVKEHQVLVESLFRSHLHQYQSLSVLQLNLQIQTISSQTELPGKARAAKVDSVSLYDQ